MSIFHIVIASKLPTRNINVCRNFWPLHVSRVKSELFCSIRRHCCMTVERHVDKEIYKSKNWQWATKLSLGGFGTVTACILRVYVNRVSCEKNRITGGIKVDDKYEPQFKWKKFFQYLYPHLWYLLLAVVSAFIVAILNIWIPKGVGDIINVVAKLTQQSMSKDGSSVLITNIFESLAKPAIRLAYMYVAQAFFSFVYIYILSGIGERIALKLRQDMFKSIIMQDIAFFDKNRTGEIVNRLTSDIQDFKSAFKMCISQGLRSTTQIIGCVISIMVISPQLTGIMVLSVPTVIFIGTLLGSSLRNLSREAQNQTAKSTAVCEEAISNVRTVRAFAAEEREIELYSKEIKLASELHEKLGFGIGLFQAGTNLFLNGIVLCTLYMGGYLMSTGELIPGDLMAFLMATQTIQRSLTQLSLLFGSYVKGISAGSRIYEYIDMPPSPLMINGEIIKDRCLRGNIVFKDVTFSYPIRPEHVILRDFNLIIPAGKTIAIVGSSGNGKTTIATLLERLYDVDKGLITIDGIDIRLLNPNYLRGEVLGYINQEPVLFSTSIMENIRYGKHDATDEEVIKAAKEANAHEFIIKFPNDYDTLVGERGAQLSGGQKQRVAIARALLKKPSIFILDEATSALDYESERFVQKALDSVTKGRTVLIIAHRLSTVKAADIIVVLQNGVIVEMGTHSELIEKKGAYYNLVNQQEKEKDQRQYHDAERFQC